MFHFLSNIHIDSTVTLSLVIAFCTLFSNIAVSLISNIFTYKMKKLDLKSEVAKEAKFYNRSIYEIYLQHTAKCIYHPDDDIYREYAETFMFSLAYFPEHLHKLMFEIDECIIAKKFNLAIPLLKELAIKVHTHLSQS